ncbi:MAG: hypothetical protein FJ388_16265 [Verrucomicrobia bacterium]|nr:hypothetical protein [Verrucomicrobiota bacterium]
MDYRVTDSRVGVGRRAFSHTKENPVTGYQNWTNEKTKRKVLDFRARFCDFPRRHEPQAQQGPEQDHGDTLTGVNGPLRHTLGSPIEGFLFLSL